MAYIDKYYVSTGTINELSIIENCDSRLSIKDEIQSKTDLDT